MYRYEFCVRKHRWTCCTSFLRKYVNVRINKSLLCLFVGLFVLHFIQYVLSDFPINVLEAVGAFSFPSFAIFASSCFNAGFLILVTS